MFSVQAGGADAFAWTGRTYHCGDVVLQARLDASSSFLRWCNLLVG